MSERAIRLLYEVYHQAWHALDDGDDAGFGDVTIDKAANEKLNAAMDAFEEAFPKAAHGEDMLDALLPPASSGAGGDLTKTADPIGYVPQTVVNWLREGRNATGVNILKSFGWPCTEPIYCTPQPDPAPAAAVADAAKQMIEFAQRWRDDAFEASAALAERFGQTLVAADIRALAADAQKGGAK